MEGEDWSTPPTAGAPARPAFYQPQANSPIYKMTDDGPVIWLNWWYVEGIYRPSVPAFQAAKERMLERDHASAIVEDNRRSRGLTLDPDPLYAALEASVQRPRYTITDVGREALAESDKR